MLLALPIDDLKEVRAAMAVTRLFDTSDAVELFAPQSLYLKPIARLTISVMFPKSKVSPKLISNWELMETLKKMVYPEQLTSLRVSRSTMEFIRFEAELENKKLVQTVWEKINNKSIRVNGIDEMARVMAVVSQVNFPSPSDWESFFRTAETMNEALPGERPDTIHMEGLPCKWLSSKQLNKEKPVEEILQRVFGRFGEIRNIDIPMLDPYREEMTGKKFNTFSTGGLPTFEAYVQYQECAGFERAMASLRGMKLVYKGEDGKALACNIKVTFDTTKHLSDSAIEKRQLERLKLQELERQREEQKRRDKEEEQLKEAERKHREEERVRERRRKEKLRRREHRQKESGERRRQRKLWKIEVESEASAWEERKLVLAQRKLDSYRLLTVLLNGVREMIIQRSHLPERDTVRCDQKSEGCERARDSVQKTPEGDTTGNMGSQRVKSEAWREVKAHVEDFDGKVQISLSRKEEPLSPQGPNFAASSPPLEERGFSSQIAAGEEISMPYESASLQITVTQDRSAHPQSLHAPGHENCLCNGYSRKVTAVDHRRLYEHGDFLSCLQNYHRHVRPSDPNRASICHGAGKAGDHSDWCRTVSENGESFRVHLRNTSSPLCIETGSKRQNRWPDNDCDWNYRWTILVNEAGVQRRAFSGSSSSQQKECKVQFQVRWKDARNQIDFEEDLASAYRVLLKDSVVLGCKEGRSISHPEHPRIEVKNSRRPSKEPWRNPLNNWKVSITNSQNNLVQQRRKESDQCRGVINQHNSLLNSQCQAEPCCTKKESTNEQSRAKRKMERLHEENICEFGADVDWLNCKSGFHHDSSNQESNEASEENNNVPASHRSDLKYSWKESKSKFIGEPNNSGKLCFGHQRNDLRKGKDAGEIPGKELVLTNQLCKVFSEEMKHKKPRTDSKTKIISEARNNKDIQNPLDSNRDLKTHWKHVKSECLDEDCSSERCFANHPALPGDRSSCETDCGLDLGVNGTQTYFHTHFANDHRLFDVNVHEQKMKKYEADMGKFDHCRWPKGDECKSK
ncbi:A-kinase anchor protein 17B-like isoform X1 [Hemitrygon akajei]|uniref:A-kinase anchor protein 17B-like isoform X1 n=2 Tax=Hemitrygon akajei TaxID=2704970 RepID=UPI003BF9A02F